MVTSNLFDYSDAYIDVKAIITVPNTAAQSATVNNTNKKVTFKNCAPFTNFISKINNAQADDAQDIDIVMPVSNLIEYIRTSANLWQYYRYETALDNNNNIIDFSAYNMKVFR